MCMECRQTPCHPRCPNAPEPKFKHTCSFCDEGILNGEQYIVSELDKYAHWECFNLAGTWELMEWLEFEIKEMENDDYD